MLRLLAEEGTAEKFFLSDKINGKRQKNIGRRFKKS